MEDSRSSKNQVKIWKVVIIGTVINHGGRFGQCLYIKGCIWDIWSFDCEQLDGPLLEKEARRDHQEVQ